MTRDELIDIQFRKHVVDVAYDRRKQEEKKKGLLYRILKALWPSNSSSQ